MPADQHLPAVAPLTPRPGLVTYRCPNHMCGQWETTQPAATALHLADNHREQHGTGHDPQWDGVVDAEVVSSGDPLTDLVHDVLGQHWPTFAGPGFVACRDALVTELHDHLPRMILTEGQGMPAQAIRVADLPDEDTASRREAAAWQAGYACGRATTDQTPHPLPAALVTAKRHRVKCTRCGGKLWRHEEDVPTWYRQDNNAEGDGNAEHLLVFSGGSRDQADDGDHQRIVCQGCQTEHTTPAGVQVIWT